MVELSLNNSKSFRIKFRRSVKRPLHERSFSEKYLLFGKFQIILVQKILAQVPLSPPQSINAIKMFENKCYHICVEENLRHNYKLQTSKLYDH